MASDPPPPYSSKPLPISPFRYTPPSPLSSRSRSLSSNHSRASPATPISRSGSSGSAGRVHQRRDDPARAARRRIAAETIAAMAEGIYSARGVSFNLRRRVKAMTEGVKYYAPDERVAMPARVRGRTEIAVVYDTTLDAARRLERMHIQSARAAWESGSGSGKATVTLSPGAMEDEERWDFGISDKKFPIDNEADVYGSTNRGEKSAGDSKAKDFMSELPLIGILSSAAPIDPSSNFLAGENGQELSIARASTLSAALKTRAALPFYHSSVEPATGSGTGSCRKESTKTAYYSHAMIYAPGVSVIKDEQGEWTPPMAVDVITCTAVHAGDARAAAAAPSSSASPNAPSSSRPTLAAIEAQIERTTTERLARVLAVFASHSVYTLVLPAFGAGNFRNDIASVARIYAALLVGPKAPFAFIFDRVVFAITPEAKWREFEKAFWSAVPGRRRDQHAGPSGTQRPTATETPTRPLGLRTLAEDVPENSDGRSIMINAQVEDEHLITAIPSTQRRPPRQQEDGASVGDWRLSIRGLSLEDGRATAMSRRSNRSADEASKGAGDDWRSSIVESQDGALEYV